MRCSDAQRLAIGLCTLGWVVTVAAADVAPTQLAELPWLQIAVGSLIALWGGLTRSADRITAAPRLSGRLAAELMRDMVVAASCGFVTVMIGAWQSWSVWFLGVALWTAGYLGARFLERVAEWVSARILPAGQPK